MYNRDNHAQYICKSVTQFYIYSLELISTGYVLSYPIVMSLWLERKITVYWAIGLFIISTFLKGSIVTNNYILDTYVGNYDYVCMCVYVCVQV